MITKEKQNELAKLSKIIAMARPWYLRDSTNDNFQFIKKKILKLPMSTIVNGTDMANMIVDSGLYSAVVGAYHDSIGSVEEIDDTDMTSFIDSMVATGRGAWRVEWDSKNKKISAVQSSSYFHSIIDWEKVFSEIKIYKRDFDTFAFVRTFFTGRNENKLYRVVNSSNLEDSREVPLATLDVTSFLDEVEMTGMSVPAFISFDSWDRIFENIQSLVDSTDRRMTQIELEFHKSLEADKLFKNISVPEYALENDEFWNKKILIEKFGKNFFSEDPNAKIEYIVNTNPMIEKAMDFINHDIRRISAISKVPLDYLWVETTGAIGAESRNAKNAIFFAKVERLRSFIEKAYSILVWSTLNFWPIIGYDQSNSNAQNSRSDQGTTNG